MKGPIARSTIRTSVVLALRTVVQAGTLLLVARMLGPEQFGVFAGVTALGVLLGTLSDLGTHLVLLGEVSKDPKRRNHVLRYALPTTLLCGSVLFLAFLAASVSIFGLGSAWLPVLIAVGVADLLLQPLFRLVAMEHHALGRVAASQLLQILPHSLRLVSVILVIALQLDPRVQAYSIGYLAASLVALAFGIQTLASAWPSRSSWRLMRRDQLVANAGYALINISRAGPSELDKTLALKLLPQSAAGMYAAAARAVTSAILPVTAMNMSALPRLFRESADRPRGGWQLLRYMFAAAFLFALLFSGILWFTAPVFNWIFGKGFEGVAEIVRWLCLAVPALALRLVAGNALLALGRVWMRVSVEIIGVLFLFTGSVILTAQFGVAGMPIALAIAELAMACVGCLLVFLALREKLLSRQVG